MDESRILDVLAGIGQEILATKYLSVACATILFYEYFLTFSDEIRYAWRGRKTWVSVLFFLNRYLPIAYKIWDLAHDGQYQYTQLVTWTSKNVTSYCTTTTFVENSYLVLVTLLSQVFLAMRVYAVGGRSKISLAVLSVMTILQLGYGVAYTAVFRREAATFVSLAHPEEYTFAACLQDPDGTALQLGYLGSSLAFDVTAFLMIATSSYNATQVFRNSSLFSRVVQDATVYFLVIAWMHLTIIIYVGAMGDARILMLFPAITNTIIPVMICRLVLSLRKAADPTMIRAWNVDHFSSQIVTRRQSVPMSPLRFQPSLSAIISSDRGTGTDTGMTLTPSVVNRSAFDSGWTINVVEEDENSQVERGYKRL